MNNHDEKDEDDYKKDRWKRRRPNPFDFLGPFGRFFDDEEFQDFESLFNEILNSPMFRNMFRELSKHRGTKNNPYVWGFSVRPGPDGKPRVQPFGNTKQNAPSDTKTATSDTREPLVDVFEEKNLLRIIIEMPGVNKRDIDLRAKRDKLRVKAQTNGRNYYKELELPAEVIPAKTKARFKNGVLEVEIEKLEKNTDSGKRIDIE